MNRDSLTPFEEKLRDSINQCAVSYNRELAKKRFLKEASARFSKKNRSPLSVISWLFHPQLTWSHTAAYTLLIFVIIGLFYIVQPVSGPVQSVQFVYESNQQETQVSRLWLNELQSGNFVMVPKGISAKILLKDQSLLSCSPETQIAVRFGSERNISLQGGAIRVEAAKDTERLMLVQTPFGKIEVIGTVFNIRLDE